MPYYLGVTIGPIDQLLGGAKTARELWVTSYFISRLSYLLASYQPASNTYSLKLLSPQILTTDGTAGAGVYPDRIYWIANKQLAAADIEAIKDSALEKLSSETSGLLTIQNMEDCIKIYFQQFDVSESNTSNDSFLFRMNEGFDVMELQNKWQQTADVNITAQLIGKGKLEAPEKRPVYKWRQAAKQTGLLNYVKDGVQRFPSVIEIATRPLVDKEGWYQREISNVISETLRKKDAAKGKANEETILDDTLMAKIKARYRTTAFRSHHKYVCIVQSDGDGVGAFLRNNVKNNAAELKDFSVKLARYAVGATEAVVAYGGMPVYAGGDDLLFFAPVKHKDNNGEHIFDLLKNLNESFQSYFPNYTVSISFGVSVTYYKHPMGDSRKNAEGLLFKSAKQQLGKNFAALTVQKHSGQTFDIGVRQQGGLYNAFLQLTRAAGLKDDNFLNSFMYKLHDQQKVIDTIAGQLPTEEVITDEANASIEKVKKRLGYFFKENFNEAVHRKHHGSEDEDIEDTFFKAARSLIIQTYREYSHLEPKEKIEKIYGLLRFIHFLNAKDTDE